MILEVNVTIDPCENNRDQTVEGILIKLGTKVAHGERSKVTLDKYRNNHINTIEIKLLSIQKYILIQLGTHVTNDGRKSPIDFGRKKSMSDHYEKLWIHV